MIITLSASAMRARIQSLIALKAALSGDTLNVLTPDKNFALNQQFTFHFLTAMLKISPAMADYAIDPTDLHENPDAELILQVELKTCDEIDPKMVRGLLENYIVMMTLASLSDSILSESEQRAHIADSAEYLNRLTDALSSTDFSHLRISRTI